MTKQKKSLTEREVLDDSVVRVCLAKQSHPLFFELYYWKYKKYETAPFQYEMFAMCEDQDTKLMVIAGFRGCAKTSIVTESHILWSILGFPQKKCVVVLGQTVQKARQHLSNIKDQLKNNALLRKDMGLYIKDKTEEDAILIPKFDAKIIASSAGQSIRGFRHREHRPDLIIVDDIDDVESVRTQESRDATWQWFTQEVMQAGEESVTKIVVVGNVLHPNSLICRLKTKIASGEMDGVYRGYPIADKEGNPLWVGKFKDRVGVEVKKKQVGDIFAWGSEYLLQPIPPDTKVLSLDSGRGNYHWSTEISKAISQTENYIFLLEKHNDAIRNYIRDTYEIDIHVVRPRGIILAGNNTNFENQKEKDDFRLLSNSLKHLEFLTYDNLLQRIGSYIQILEKYSK